MAKVDYTAKVDALLAHAAALGFTEEDFADLALAAADQAGADSEEQHRIASILGVTSYAMRPVLPVVVCAECGQPVDGYGPTVRDAKAAPADGLCESCHGDRVRVANRERADAIREGRGDYLRDMQRDGAL